MPTPRHPSARSVTSSRRAARALTLALLALLAWLPQGPALAQGKPGSFSAGLEVRGELNAAELGLPIYPGARPLPDKADENAALSLGLWGGSLGFSLKVAKYASRAPLDRVAAYYREALAVLGPVIDCSSGVPRALAPAAAAASAASAASATTPPSCDNKKPSVAGELIYKVGDAKNFHLVALQPREGSGVEFQIVRMQSRGL